MIAPDDPRHGTNKGYLAGCGESCCKTAHADYRRHLRTRQYLHGGPLKVDPAGTHRRLHALVALGWTLWAIDDELGKKRTYTHNLLQRDTGWILASTAEAIADVYDRMSMRFPDESTGPKRQVASRNRNLARRMGWPPPLAWDDIDDPEEQPREWEYRPATRAERLEELVEAGAGISAACTALGVSREALHKWCGRQGYRDLYDALAARELRAPNQYSNDLEVA